jgi:catechol 2,3-dioxygenase-like lactoylglutathione lyase family enzyme
MTDNHAQAQLVGINHVALEVGDLDEALAFYDSLFEFEIRGRTDTTVFVDMGDQFLPLAETDDAGSGSQHHRHVGLVVDDAGAVRDRIDAEGVETLDVPGLEVTDPWGNRLQIVEYSEIQFTKADHVLAGMGLETLEKSESAIEELAEKGMAPDDE